MLEEMSKKWLHVQMTHQVSASATEAFWKTANELMPLVYDHRNRLNIQKNVPGFKHLRRKLYKENCPEINMKYVYKNKRDNSIEIVECKKAPSRSKSNYIKLYEEANVKVNWLSSLCTLSISIEFFVLNSN